MDRRRGGGDTASCRTGRGRGDLQPDTSRHKLRIGLSPAGFPATGAALTDTVHTGSPVAAPACRIQRTEGAKRPQRSRHGHCGRVAPSARRRTQPHRRGGSDATGEQRRNACRCAGGGHRHSYARRWCRRRSGGWPVDTVRGARPGDTCPPLQGITPNSKEATLAMQRNAIAFASSSGIAEPIPFHHRRRHRIDPTIDSYCVHTLRASRRRRRVEKIHHFDPIEAPGADRPPATPLPSVPVT